MTKQPEALRIADELIALHGTTDIDERASAELRRLHAENERLKGVMRAAQDLVFQSEEYAFDDGLGRGAQQFYWDELDNALEENR